MLAQGEIWWAVASQFEMKDMEFKYIYEMQTSLSKGLEPGTTSSSYVLGIVLSLICWNLSCRLSAIICLLSETWLLEVH